MELLTEKSKNIRKIRRSAQSINQHRPQTPGPHRQTRMDRPPTTRARSREEKRGCLQNSLRRGSSITSSSKALASSNCLFHSGWNRTRRRGIGIILTTFSQVTAPPPSKAEKESNRISLFRLRLAQRTNIARCDEHLLPSSAR